jgi:hypothetical protein
VGVRDPTATRGGRGIGSGAGAADELAKADASGPSGLSGRLLRRYDRIEGLLVATAFLNQPGTAPMC